MKAYTTKTGVVVLALTLLCVFVYDMTDGYANVKDALILAGVAAIFPLTWFPALIAMGIHQWARERFDRDVAEKARQLSNNP